MKKIVGLIAVACMCLAVVLTGPVRARNAGESVSTLVTTLQTDTRFLNRWTPSDRQTLYEMFKAHGVTFKEGQAVIEKESWKKADTALLEGYTYLLGSPDKWTEKETALVNALIMQMKEGTKKP